jgi:lipopolysaccharide transport system ATP-binding protein
VGDDTVIRVEGLWKRYGLPLVPAVKKAWRGLTGGDAESADTRPWALKDMSFQVEPGEAVGIIGRNGAGKSTLLKVLAGISVPTRGRVEVRGSLFPMIELNAGMHVELSGRENVMLLGALLGISRSRVAAMVDEVREFSELDEWFDRPVRMYSSGMLARLGFSVAACSDSDILLVDEVLSVGDFAFQRKCMNWLSKQMANNARTVLFVSHNPYMVERICNRAVLLSGGRIVESGAPKDIMQHYFVGATDAATRSATPARRPLADPSMRPGCGDLRITDIEVLDADGKETDTVPTGGAMTIRLHYQAEHPINEPNFGIRILDPLNTPIASLVATAFKGGTVLDGMGFVDCAIASLPLMPNPYSIQVKVAGDLMYDLVERSAAFTVYAAGAQLTNSGNLGLVYVDGTWTYSG